MKKKPKKRNPIAVDLMTSKYKKELLSQKRAKVVLKDKKNN